MLACFTSCPHSSLATSAICCSPKYEKANDNTANRVDLVHGVS